MVTFVYLVKVVIFIRSDILQNEMKVFFVKYNDPIYVKLEKLDIMIRLTTAANIAQVLAELKELVSFSSVYSTLPPTLNCFLWQIFY